MLTWHAGSFLRLLAHIAFQSSWQPCLLCFKQFFLLLFTFFFSSILRQHPKAPYQRTVQQQIRERVCLFREPARVRISLCVGRVVVIAIIPEPNQACV